MSGLLRVRRALISVSDKRGIVDLAERLVAADVELISSGGTASRIEESGIAVTRVSDLTDWPEILGGRVKTLHPAVHGGILADRANPDHMAELTQHGISPIDLVIVNLYPFEEVVHSLEATAADAIENIDIGGPTMIRAAAKNHLWVGVVTSLDRYDEVATAVERGGLDLELRTSLAEEAFSHTAAYDAGIVGWMQREESQPAHLMLALERVQELRYGENPSQDAGLYRLLGGNPWWGRAKQHQGKEMSFNNYADAEAAWRLVNDLRDPAVAVIKHTNPCGVGMRSTLHDAFQVAWECDSLSAFGGVVALNRTLDLLTAEMIAEYFVEVVIAPSCEDAALKVLSAKRAMRVLEALPPHGTDVDIRGIEDGLLVQTRDHVGSDLSDWIVASQRPPTPDEVANLKFAWVVAAHAKSNAVVVVTDRAAVGIGVGDQSRVGAVERGLFRAGARSVGAVAASDAFFPFRDGLDVLARAGVTAVVEPGGSRNDAEVIAAADEHAIALMFAGRRHFRH